MNFVYYKTKKDAINYDIFQHIMYDFAERTRLELVTPCVTGMYSNQTELTFQVKQNSEESPTSRCGEREQFLQTSLESL